MSQIARSRVGLSTYLVPAGPLVEPEPAEALRAALESCVAAREVQVVLDLSHVTLVSSWALEVLLDGRERLAAAGGGLRAVNASPTLREIFRFTGLAERIAFANTDPPDEADPAPTQATPRRRIGEILLERGIVKPEDIERALEVQSRTGRRMAQVMVQEGWLPEPELLDALSEQLGVPFVRLRPGLFDPAVARSLDPDVSRRLPALCLFRIRDVIFLATPDPQSSPAIETVERLTGCRVKPVLACSDEIRAANASAHGLAAEAGAEGAERGRAAFEARPPAAPGAAASAASEFVDELIRHALRARASAIHVEPSSAGGRIRLRVDGSLHTFAGRLPAHAALVARIQKLAGLDPGRRGPQDGHLQLVTDGRTTRLRVGSAPGVHGERIVLRLPADDEPLRGLDALGMSDETRARFEALLRRRCGLLLLAGPPGSGRTTTLYAALRHLDAPERNLVTIEDPVEHPVDTLHQCAVDESAGLGSARLLEHALQQDPDVIAVGEIRDPETAAAALRAAQSGPLLIATVRADDAVGALLHLLGLGVGPRSLAAALLGVVGQRLLRAPCPACSAPAGAGGDVPDGAPAADGNDSPALRPGARPGGCAACLHSGYRGRRAVHEILEVDAGLRGVLANPASRDARDGLEAYAARLRRAVLR